ncbi:MAG: pyruvate kinase, partial [Candidatus Bipolaricaulia bacterium]
QMLKSMTENPAPTRAEVADVANAILDGTDAIMLSEETAVGNYPIEAVRMMSRIAERLEKSPTIYHRYEMSEGTVTEAIGESACQIADRIGAAAIIPSTTSGSTAKLVAKFRPRTPIIAVTYTERVRNKLALVWGVYPVHVEFSKDTDAMLKLSIEAAARAGQLPSGSLVVITAGVPFGVPGTTNLIKVERI